MLFDNPLFYRDDNLIMIANKFSQSDGVAGTGRTILDMKIEMHLTLRDLFLEMKLFEHITSQFGELNIV